MFRFKLRTLLIATSLVGLFVGLQVHVHNKAKRFVEEMRNPSEAMREQLVRDSGSSNNTRYLNGSSREEGNSALLMPVSFGDAVFLRRRCEVTFLSVCPIPEGQLYKEHRSNYTLSLSRCTCATETINTESFFDIGRQIQGLYRDTTD